MQEFHHALTRGGNVGSFLVGLGFNGFGERSVGGARLDQRDLFGKLLFELGKDECAVEASGVEFTCAAKGRAESAAFEPTSREQIAGFDFHIHDKRELIGHRPEAMADRNRRQRFEPLGVRFAF